VRERVGEAESRRRARDRRVTESTCPSVVKLCVIVLRDRHRGGGHVTEYMRVTCCVVTGVC
jgi:hypothetical protein